MRNGSNGKPKRVRKRTRSAVRRHSSPESAAAHGFDAVIAKLEANAAELEERILKIQAQLRRQGGG
jgi:16S rRNA G1207 methylase RsmC